SLCMCLSLSMRPPPISTLFPYTTLFRSPQELAHAVTERAASGPVADDVDDFLRRVAEHLGAGTDPEAARIHVTAVFSTLTKAVSAGEIDDLRSQLPAGFAAFLDNS